VFLLWVLVGLGDVDGYPTLSVGVEESPAVVAAHLSGSAFFWQGKTNFKLGRDLVRTSKAHEEAVKVSAVAIAIFASPNRVAPAPPGAFFAVAHVAVDRIIKNAGRLGLIRRHLLVLDQLQRLAHYRN